MIYSTLTRSAASLALVAAVLALSAGACSPRDAGEATLTATAPVDEPFHVVSGWPKYPEGVRIGQATAVAVNSANEVILFQRGLPGDRGPDGLLEATTLLVFDAQTGELRRTLGEGLFANPHGLDVDDEGNLWVADNRQHQVMKLSPTGDVLLTLGEAGVAGDGDGLFNGVTDVAVAPDGSFWVSDGYGNNRVLKFAADGTQLFVIGGERGAGPGQFDLPHGITVDHAGRAYVADRTNARVQVFDADGTFVAQWVHWAGQAPGDAGRPWGLEYHDGSVYVADGGEYWLVSQYRSERPDTLPFDLAQLQRFDLEGTLLEAWGHFGPQDGRMIWPHDVSVDADGSVYSVEVHDGQRLQKWARGGGIVR